MKLKQILHLSILALVASTSTIMPNANGKGSLEGTQKPLITKTESIAKAGETIFINLQELDQTVTELAIRVSSGQVKKIKDKSTTIVILSQLRELITFFQKVVISIEGFDANKQVEIIFNIQEMSEFISLYLLNAVKTNLADLQPFDPMSYVTKRKPINPADFTSEKLNKKFNTTKKSIQTLRDGVNTMGLTWYNKAARKVNDNIVTPLNKYHIPTIAGIGIPTALFAAALVWKFGHPIDSTETATKQSLLAEWTIGANSWLRKTFGEPWERDSNGQARTPSQLNAIMAQKNNTTIDVSFTDKSPTAPDAKFHLLPPIDYALCQMISHQAPLLSIAGGMLLSSYFSAWSNNIKPWLDIKISKAWNSLLGGAYEQNFVKGYWDFTPRFTFEDMNGLGYVKAELDLLIDFLEDPERRTNSKLDVEKGWLITGESRSGKSYSIECFCGEVNRRMPGKYKFWKIDAASVKYFGIKNIFDMAKAEAPVILYIDEIHLLIENPTDDITRTLLHDFLTTMQSTLDGNKDSGKPVILFTATNEEWKLPPAVRNHGRLGKEIRIEFPTLQNRITFITDELTKKALNLKEFDINRLALKTHGRTFEAINAMIRNALIFASMFNIPLTQELLERSFNTEVRDILMDDRKDLPDHEKAILASHFAARGLCILLSDSKLKLDTITIKGIKTDTKHNHNAQKKPIVTYGALFTKPLNDTIKMNSRNEVVNEIKALIAGFVGEELLLGSCGYTCHPENNEMALSLIQTLVFEGITDRTKLSKQDCNQRLDKSTELLAQYKAEVAEVLENNREVLAVITDILMERGILTDEELMMIIDAVKNKAAEPTKTDTPETTETQTDIPVEEPVTADIVADESVPVQA